MKKNPIIYCLLLTALLGWHFGYGQIVTTASTTFSSVNPKKHLGREVSDMLSLDKEKIFELKRPSNLDLTGGILGYVQGKGKITLSMHAYDEAKADGRGKLLYQCYNDNTSLGNFIDKSNSIGSEDPNFPLGPINSSLWTSTDFRLAVMSEYLYRQNISSEDSPFANLPAMPVIIEVTVDTGVLQKFKLPLLGEFDAVEFVRGLPTGHGCIGKTTAECTTLEEIRTGTDNTKVIVTAHRGFWGYGNIPEGSMGALKNGYEHKYVSIELDFLLSKDKEVLMLHDQRVNRMISLGKTHPTYDKDDADDPRVRAAWVGNLNYNTTTPNIPATANAQWPSYPALKEGFMIDRRGEVTTEKVSRLEDALDYIKDKPILLSVDIKERTKDAYLECVSLCLTSVCP